jgi:hypothetical protein
LPTQSRKTLRPALAAGLAPAFKNHTEAGACRSTGQTPTAPSPFVGDWRSML